MESVDAALLSLPEDITLQSVHPTPTSVLAHIACQRKSAACPQCQQPSIRVHGYYTRTVADLPCAGRRVVFQLRVRKFVCSTPTCPQQVITRAVACTGGLVCADNDPAHCAARSAWFGRRWRAGSAARAALWYPDQFLHAPAASAVPGRRSSASRPRAGRR